MNRQRRKAGWFKKTRGHWKRYRGNPLRRNITAGFYDEEGIFHPIRASKDYSASRAGEGRRASSRAGKKKAKKRKRGKR